MRAISMRIPLLLVAALFPASPLQSGELPGRASLADLHAIGQIIVTMSAGATGEENTLRQVIEKRLGNAGIAIDPTEGTQLVANVDVARDTSTSGQKHFAYLISLSLQEPVRTERVPRTTFRATTWSASATVSRFSVDAPFEMIVDAIENKMSSFLTTVAKDTATAKDHPPAGRQ
jgi:hypothetical protein